MPVDLSDVAALGVSTGLVLAYYLYLRFRLKSDPQFTVHAANNAARARWAEAMMSAPGQEILAIQTLRNSVMTASFMASTAILLMIATLTLMVSQNTGGVLHALNPFGATDDRAVAFKLLLLLAAFFTAFFCFAMAVRFFNHVGYMITVPAGGRPDAMPPARVGVYLNRGGNFYALGTRAFFYCVPLVFWLLSPVLFVAATGVLIAALYPLDRAPRVP